MGRFERLTAKMERLVKQAENNPGTWFSELSSKVMYSNGTYYVDAYKLGKIFEFYRADPVVALLVEKVIHELATDRPELKDTY